MKGITKLSLHTTVWFQDRQVTCVLASTGGAETTLVIISTLLVLDSNLLIWCNSLYGNNDTGMGVWNGKDLGRGSWKKV